MTVDAVRTVRVFLPCTGLGREARGFETFTRSCAAAMRGVHGAELTVFGGGGVLEAPERRVASLSRRGATAAVLGAVLRRDPYFVEQATFAAAFLPALVGGDPDVVYFADLNLGNALWHWRRLTGQRYRMLFYNGGATTQPFTRCDLVQQVSPEHLEAARARGEAMEREVLLPHGATIARDFAPAGAAERARTRTALGVPVSGALVLSVGALDASVKRMDYVIREVASLPSPRPHLLLLGTETAETPVLRRLATDALGAGGCTMATVPQAAALDAYRAADAFVLASLREGFGLAHVEALASGVPCLAHATATTAYIYGDDAVLGDLRSAGALTAALAATLVGGGNEAAARGRHERAYARFSWDALAPRYLELFRACADGRAPRLETA